MKVMFCTSSMGKGGAERVISILSNDFVKNNKVSILINTDKNIAYELDKKINIITLDKKYYKNNLIRNIYRISQTKKILKKEKPDIIVSFLPMPSFRILIANKKTKIPVIISDRNDPKQEYKSKLSNRLMNWLYPKADAFVFQTNEQKEYFSKEIQQKSTVIFNPIKDSFLKTRDIEIKTRENIIINVGRLVSQKNQKMLISAFVEVSKKHPEYKLEIFGEGPLKEKLQEQINELKMNDKIFLCGITDNIKQELEKSKIFVLSSDYEGMPNSLIEAMAVGCVVISTDCPCGGPRELIQNNENGLLIPIRNDEELIKSMNFVIEHEENAEIMSKNAKNVKEILNTNYILEEWKKYIKEVKECRNE